MVTDPAYAWWASETFALYSELAPTVFVHVGIRNEQLGTTGGHHTDVFQIDEAALPYGIGAMVQFVLALSSGTDISSIPSERSYEGVDTLVALPDIDPNGGADLFLRRYGNLYPADNKYSTAKADSVLTLLPDFPAMLQTTEWSCGNVAALMVLNYMKAINDETEASLASKMHTHVDSRTPGAQPGSAVVLHDFGTSIGEMHKYFASRGDLRIVSSAYRTDYTDGDLLSDTLHTGSHTAGNLSPSFRTYDEAGAFLLQTLRRGLPVIVCWNEWGGHWTVIIGYDNGGTPALYDDDILIMADPYDTFDRHVDGRISVPLTQFFYSWYCWLTPKPWQLQPYIIIEGRQPAEKLH